MTEHPGWATAGAPPERAAAPAASPGDGTGARRGGLNGMHSVLRFTGLFVLTCPAAVFAQAAPAVPVMPAETPVSAPAPPPARAIVQQRLPDGRVIFTDRPQPGAKTERRWATAPEDPAAEARLAASQRESAAVSERIGRQIEQQRERDQELALARAKAAQAEAERARADAEQPPQQVVIVPHRRLRARPPPRPSPPEVRPPERPGPKLPPRPGATPPPGTLVEH